MDAQGCAGFRGFKGLYDVEVASPDGKVIGKVKRKLGPGEVSTWHIRTHAD